jgi:guanylate kinase
MISNAHPLSEKTAVLLVGPTAVGKSTVMNAALQLDERFSRATGFTTRAPRPNDEPGQYRYLARRDVEDMQASGDLLQFAHNPANDQLYGTTVADFPNEYNMKDTLSSAVQEFESLPFKACRVISLTVEADAWHQWLLSRYPERSAERTQRLQEALISITWSLSRTHNHHWLINSPGQELRVARELIDSVLQPSKSSPAPKQAIEMYQRITDLLS